LVKLEVRDGVARITLDAPPLNVLTLALLRELRDRLHLAAEDRAVRVLVLDAAGRHFSAGASVEEHLAPEFQVMIPEFGAAVQALYAFPLPVIAAVQGRCLGGAFELVQAADIVVAGEGAQFGQPEILLGVFAPAACILLPRRVPRGLAAELLFTGDPIGGAAAAAAGLVQRLVPDAEVAQAAESLALRIARHSAAALRAHKRALRAAQNTGFGVGAGLAAAIEIYETELMQTRDADEGLRAFLEKRQPQWSHA
jgi:cyclohexa-1,5-dienecarbonyl-CoA hydratase